MLNSYIRTQIVNAEPAVSDGRAGYHVYFPTGCSAFMSEHDFETTFRRLTAPEREVLAMTEAEAQVAMISDGEHDVVCTNPGGHEFSDYRPSFDAWLCKHCDHQSLTDPHKGADPP